MDSRLRAPLSTMRKTCAVSLLLSALLVAACGGGVSEEELDQVRTELSGVAEQQQTLQEAQSALATDVTHLQGGLTKVEGDLTGLSAETSTLKSDVTTAQTDASTASEEVRTIGSQVSDLRNSFTLTRDEVTTGRDKLERLELAHDSALKLARLSLIYDLYSNFILTNSLTNSRAAQLAIHNLVIQADDPGLVSRWDPLSNAWTRALDREFETQEQFSQLVEEVETREDAFLAYLRISQEQTLDDWDQ